MAKLLPITNASYHYVLRVNRQDARAIRYGLPLESNAMLGRSVKRDGFYERSRRTSFHRRKKSSFARVKKLSWAREC
jgi:hypothetical protein